MTEQEIAQSMEPASHTNKKTVQLFSLSRSAVPLTLPSLSPCHVHTECSLLPWQLTFLCIPEQEDTKIIAIQFYWADIFWRACLDYSGTAALISGVLFQGILKYVMVHTSALVSKVDLCQLSWFKRPRWGASVFFTILNWWTALVNSSYAHSNTADFWFVMALNTSCFPFEVIYLLLHILCTHWQGYFMISILLPPYNTQQDKRTSIKNSELWVSYAMACSLSGLCWSLLQVQHLLYEWSFIFLLKSRWIWHCFFAFQLLCKKIGQLIRIHLCVHSDKLTSHYCSKTLTSFWVETFYLGTRTCNNFLLGRSYLYFRVFALKSLWRKAFENGR